MLDKEVTNTGFIAAATIVGASFAVIVFHAPEVNTVRAVIVHTIKVSTMTSKLPQNSCFVGWSFIVAAWAIGAVPIPASFEYNPRANPQRIAAATPAPANPPAAERGVKAWVKINEKAAGISEKLTAKTVNEQSNIE